jgi:hypothetical protein
VSAEQLLETPAGEIYDVFAKVKADDPLYHVGTVIASEPDLARVYAFTLYQEWTWDEMIAAPRREIIPVIEVA